MALSRTVSEINGDIFIISPPQLYLCSRWAGSRCNFVIAVGLEKKETLLSPTNRATHLCKCNGVADLKSNPSPYVLPRRIWSRMSATPLHCTMRHAVFSDVHMHAQRDIALPTLSVCLHVQCWYCVRMNGHDGRHFWHSGIGIILVTSRR